MDENTGIIIVLAYPETIVMVADEWYSPFLKYFGIGTKNYVRAGHAALVLIDKERGELEYHDFGRYITSIPNGRVRGAKYDRELEFPIRATIVNDSIQNLSEILEYLATNPQITHGEGKLIASVCDEVNYAKAKMHIVTMQEIGMIRYAAFIKNASNCARFVTSSLAASVTNLRLKRRLIRSQWFTPSTVGNVVIASTTPHIYEISTKGKTSLFTSTVSKENRTCFLDRLSNFQPNFKGNLHPVAVNGLHENSQWLGGIAAGAWFELTAHEKLGDNEYRFRRISPYGFIDVDAVFVVKNSFSSKESYEFLHYSNCLFCTVKQNGEIFKLNYVRDF